MWNTVVIITNSDNKQHEFIKNDKHYYKKYRH